MQETIAVDEVVVLFAGDSGDGMQLTGNQFTNTSAVFGNDVSTFPNFPAEIRAPQGTVGGVSGFQVKFGSHRLYTPGDEADVLVVMNAAALVANIHKLKKGGVLIANLDGFDSKNLKLAGCDNENPLETEAMHDFNVQAVNITRLTVEALVDTAVPRKEAGRSKNMFVLGLLYWMYNRSMEPTEIFIKNKFKKKPELVEANLKVLRTGYHFGETSEAFASRYSVKPAQLEPGVYRNIMGNQATAIGLVAAAKKAGLELFFGTYPITPASDILHELSRHRNFGVKTFQAEDEIAAIAASIGASFGGSLGVTSSSGPGIALKTEAMGLATILEIPLVVINVQRGGPSTGLPTKTEQADLFQALYGRNGEAQIPVVCAHSPHDAFDAIFEATRIAVEYMTPVMFLSDGYIANGAEPWKFPKAEDLPTITHRKISATDDEKYLPYKRDEKLVRTWAVPGTAGLEHRIGGLEKDDLTGNISYDPDNHQLMVKTRAEKISRMADDLPLQEIHQGDEKGKVLVLGWGSTFGSIQTAVAELIAEGYEIGHAHLRYVSPLPKNLGEILSNYDEVVIPEMNDGQLVNIIQAKYLKKCQPLKKIKGIPFTAKEIKEFVVSIYQAS